MFDTTFIYTEGVKTKREGYRMKKLAVVMGLLLLSLLMVGCSEAYVPSEDGGTTEESSVSILTSSTRKVIYTVEMGIRSKHLLPVYDEIVDLLNPDEWIESQQVGTRNGRLVLRIKTTRLQAFTTLLRDAYEVTYFNTTSVDVSLNYANNQTRIEGLEAEQDRLIELFQVASISEQILINQRLSVIETELRNLNNENNQTDAYIEYSQVTIYMNSSAPYESLNFGQKVQRAFFGGIDAFVTVVETLILALLALLPFAAVGVPSVLGIIYLNKRNYQKRIAKRNAQRTK